MDLRNRFHGIDSASLCSLAGRYDNPIPTRLLAPIDCSKIPELIEESRGRWKGPWISHGKSTGYHSEWAIDIHQKGPWISLGKGSGYPLKGPWISLRKDPGYPRKGLWDIPRKGPWISLYILLLPNSCYPTPVRITP
jgi:hypothetical protein